MAEAGRICSSRPSGRGQGDRVPAVERALGFGVERADRLDLVAEELDADRVGGVRGKDVEDAAAEAELAGDLDDLGPRHPPLEQPRRQLLDGHGCRRRPIRATSAPAPRAWALAGAAPGRGRRPGGAALAPARRLDHAQPLAEDLVAGVLLARGLFPCREDFRHDPREHRDVIAEVVDVADVGQHDDERRGCMQAERGRRQPGGRAPGPVDGRRAAVLECRQGLGKTRARWICRVRSLKSTAGATAGVTWAGRAAALRETLGIEYSLDHESRPGQRIRRSRIRSFRPASHC